MNEEPLEPPPAPWASSPIEDAASPRRSRRRRVAGLLGIVAVALLVVGGVATALVTTGRLGRPAPAEPRVALVDPDGALATVNASGGNRTVHAAPGTQFTFPAWSPDGTRIAALATTGDTVAVRVYDTRPNASADGTVLYASSDAPPFYLYWTPDSRAVTFLTATGPDIALRSAPADASAEATVVREGAPMYWAWEAPDRMLVHAGAADSAFLGSMRPDGTTISPIAGSMGDFRAPAASGDGHYEAFLLAKPDGGGAVVAATADGGSRHEAAVFGSAAFGFGPSGSRLAFVAADSADRVAPFPLGTLRVMDAATGALQSLPATSVVAFFWSPDGRRIATIGLQSPADPSTAGRARLASVRQEAEDARPDPTAQGVPVGVQFIDVDAGSATPLQAVDLSPLFVNQVLPYFDQYALSHRVWSPDAASILLPTIAGDGSEQLELLPADGSASRVLSPGSMGFWSP